jgi:tetrahydromethanopterin S-methyltransferase subunit A
MAQTEEAAKKPATAGKVKVTEWPAASGDYVVGEPDGCVAVATLASAGIVKTLGATKGVALCGECKTENVGTEKVILNVISNPNIRFLVVCGTEVAGHVTGGCLKALYEFGVDPESKKIRKAPGAIPYIEAIPQEGIERFRKQVEFVDLINVEDARQIVAKIEELVSRDPGAYPEPPMVIKLAEKKEKAVVQMPLLVALPPATDSMKTVIEDISYKTQLITREKRLAMAVHITRMRGFLTGFLIIIGVLLALLFGVGA